VVKNPKSALLQEVYSQAINAWIVSGYQDESWLLRGKALSD
jgi:hypothetical protein